MRSIHLETVTDQRRPGLRDDQMQCVPCIIVPWNRKDKNKNKTKLKDFGEKTGEIQLKPETLTNQLWLPRC